MKGIYRCSGPISNMKITFSLCIYCSCLGASKSNHKWSERLRDCIQQLLQHKFDWEFPKSSKTLFSICVSQNSVISELDRLQGNFFNNLPQLASAKPELSVKISNIWELSSLKHFKWLRNSTEIRKSNLSQDYSNATEGWLQHENTKRFTKIINIANN